MRRRSRRNEIVEAYDIIMTRRLCVLVILLLIILSVILYMYVTRPESATSRTIKQANQTKVIKKATTSSQLKTNESVSSEEPQKVYDMPQEQTGSIGTIEEPKQVDSSSTITGERNRQQLEAEEEFESNQELETAVDGAKNLEEQTTSTDEVAEEGDGGVVESDNQESQEETYDESSSEEKYISVVVKYGNS